MTFVIVILAGMWLLSYRRFRRKYKMDRAMCEFTRHRYEESPNPRTAVEYGSALMQCQLYEMALAQFEEAKRRDQMGTMPFLDTNIAFCRKPLPWSHGARDHRGGSWRHNFLLTRFGGRRQVAISSDTALAFNSMLRAMKRSSTL